MFCPVFSGFATSVIGGCGPPQLAHFASELRGLEHSMVRSFCSHLTHFGCFSASSLIVAEILATVALEYCSFVLLGLNFHFHLAD